MIYLDGPGLRPADAPSSGVGWTTPDPGIPLRDYIAPNTDPKHMWQTQPSVRKVVAYIAQQIAQLPWHVYQRVSDTDRQRLKDSALDALLTAPSPMVSGYELIRDLVVDACLYDRFCAILDGDRLVRLSPKRWTIKADWLGRVTNVILRTPSGFDDIDITDAPLVIGWGWSDLDAGGISPMLTLSTLLEEAAESVKWRKRQWDERPAFHGYLKHPGAFKGDDQKRRFSISWSRWASGAAGTPILEDGMEYVAAPRISPKEALDLEGRQLTDVEVAAAFHIPPELVGAREGNYSNLIAYRSMLFGPTLGPLITQLQHAVNRIAASVDKRDGVYAEISREAAINGSMMEQAQILQTMVGGPYMTRAEARGRFNLPHIDGTEDLIVPLNVLTGGQASPTDSGSQNRALTSSQKALTSSASSVFKTDDEEADEERERTAKSLHEWLAAVRLDIGEAAVTEADLIALWAEDAAERILPRLTHAARVAAQRVISAASGSSGWDPAIMDAYLAVMAASKGEQVAVGTARKLQEHEDRAAAWDVVEASVGVWAATAVTDAMGFGGHDAARHGGLRTKTWLTTSGNPRASHAAMHGETVPIDETFSNGARWPGDVVLSADESVACMCTVEFNA